MRTFVLSAFAACLVFSGAAFASIGFACSQSFLSKEHCEKHVADCAIEAAKEMSGGMGIDPSKITADKFQCFEGEESGLFRMYLYMEVEL